MTDDIKNRDNKDAEESGRPVQLPEEQQQDDTMGQPGQDRQHDKVAQPKQDC